MGLYLALPISALMFWLGARVVRTALHARALPDAMVGVYFVAMGLGGAPALLASDPHIVPPGWAPAAMAVGHALVSLGFSALLVFSWRCFGPDSTWRKALATSGGSVLLGLWLMQGWIGHFEAPGGVFVKTASIVRAGALVWALCESVRYRQVLMRRVALGLADPVIANRLLLWCGWTGSMLAAIALAIAVRFAMPDFGVAAGPALRAAIVLPFCALTVVGAASLWLAFFPPGWYLTRFRVA